MTFPIKLEINKLLPVLGLETLLNFYQSHFSNSPDSVKASIIETMGIYKDRVLITLLEPYLNSKNIQIQGAAVIALWPFTEMNGRLMNIISDILFSKDKDSRMTLLKIISLLKLKNMEDYVLDFVAMPDKKLSTLAVITSVSLGNRHAMKVLMRKLTTYAKQDDNTMVEFIFRKSSIFSDTCENCMVNELRSLDTSTFNKVKDIFNRSNEFFDKPLADLFSN